MAVKKSMSLFILAVVFVFVCCMDVGADNAGVLSYGRITVQMPELTAEIKGTGYDLSDMAAVLGNEVLQVDCADAYNAAEHSVCAYILVDLSKSMRSSFDLLKTNIVNYVNLMGDSDRVILITFGENEVTTLLDGHETKEEIIGAVNGLQCTENGTMFYEALARAYQMSNSSVSSFDREYALVFSDGIDEQMGNSTYDEIAASYRTHSLPLYAACPTSTSKEAADRFGELARLSGGSFMFVKDEQMFDTLLSDINNITLVRMSAAGNAADGSHRQLSIRIGGLQAEQSIPIARSMEDKIPPEVSSIRYDKKNRSVFIVFSEAVDHALDSSSYSVRDSKGEAADVTSVVAVSSESCEVELKLNGLHNGKYTISFHGITDCSKEANPLEGSQTVMVGNIKNTEEKEEDGTSVPMLLLVAAIVLLAGVIVILSIVLIRKKKKKENTEDMLSPAPVQRQAAGQAAVLNVQQVEVFENRPVMQKQVKYHIKNNESLAITMTVKTGNQAVQKVHMEVVSSVIVGRAAACDICIDDTKLSRQHFVIEYEKGSLFLSDLHSRNGTMLNGIRVAGRQRLKNGDKIFAGLSDMIIQF